MAKRKEKRRELTARQWQDKFCAELAHEVAILTIKGRPTLCCFECNAFWLYIDIRGLTPRTLAARHFTAN